MKETSKEKRLRRIAKIIETLEKEERKYSWIRDKRGMRYIPSDLFVKMEEWEEAQNYMKWFLKHFPRDKGFPEFLLEWTIIHFKNGNMKEAKFKTFETWCSNINIFNKYFDTEIHPVDFYTKDENELPEYTKFIHFKSGNPKMADFEQWLKQTIADPKFQKACDEFIRIRKALLNENDSAIRAELNKEEANLKYLLD